MTKELPFSEGPIGPVRPPSQFQKRRLPEQTKLVPRFTKKPYSTTKLN
jgi:hypothetical protein